MESVEHKKQSYFHFGIPGLPPPPKLFPVNCLTLKEVECRSSLYVYVLSLCCPLQFIYWTFRLIINTALNASCEAKERCKSNPLPHVKDSFLKSRKTPEVT